MNHIDSNGHEFFIDLDCKVHHLVNPGTGDFYSYENIIKNHERMSDYFKTFNVKIYNADGTPGRAYQEISEEGFKAICQHGFLRELTERFNPEFLI